MSETITEIVAPASTAEDGCEDCNNASDPITLEEIKDIPSEFVFKVRDKTVTHCFDIRALYQYYDKCGKLENPLNRTVFSEETLDDFLKRIIQLGLTSERDTETIREDRDRQDNEDDTVEIITVFRSDGSRSRNHRRRNRVGSWTNVSVSSAILDAMGQGNSIARAVHRLHTNDFPERRRPPIHAPPPPERRPTQFSSRPVQTPPPSRQKMETFAPPKRDYLEHSIQHESILAASRPSTGGGSAGTMPEFSSRQHQRPLLQTFYNGELPDEMRAFASPQPTFQQPSRPEFQQPAHQDFQQPNFQQPSRPEFQQPAHQNFQQPNFQQPSRQDFQQSNFQPPSRPEFQHPPRPLRQPPTRPARRIMHQSPPLTTPVLRPAAAASKSEPTDGGVNWVLVGLLLAVGALVLTLLFPGLTSWLR